MIIIIFLLLFYAGLLGWYTYSLSQKKQAAGELSSSPVSVTVIVAARNEEQNLPKLLHALSVQDYPSSALEIIIVNDRSSDKTSAILDQAASDGKIKVLHIHKTPEGWAPKKWALNTAIDSAGGCIILQTDADCIPGPYWVPAFAKAFSDKRMGFIAGPSPLTASDSFTADLFLTESLAQEAFAAGSISAGHILTCTGRNMAFRKKVFQEIIGYSGFEHVLSGDDDLLLQKIASQTGWKIQYLSQPESLVPSPAPKTVSEFVSQRLRFASKGMAYYSLSTRIELKLILPFLYLVNLGTVVGMLIFAQNANAFYLLPWLIKTLADGFLTRYYFRLLDTFFPWPAFFMLSVLHPFYIVIFGALGPLSDIKWKS